MGDVIDSGIKRKSRFQKDWIKFELLLTALASIERQNPNFNSEITLEEIALALDILQRNNPAKFGSLSMTENIIGVFQKRCSLNRFYHEKLGKQK